MKLRSLLAPAASAALFFSPGGASAEEDPGLRARGNAIVGGGPMIISHAVPLGVVGASIQLGAQFNDFVALYGALDFGWGADYGGGGALLDFTFKDAVSVGLGPEFGLLTAGARNLVIYDWVIGGRFHFAWYPYVYRNEDGHRRGLALGVDAHVFAGPPGFLGNSDHSPGSFYSHGSLAVLPMAFAGWSFF